MAVYDASPEGAPNVTYLWAQLLIEELVRNGVTTFFVAPGSRSTPLTVAAGRHPHADVVLHVDERGTAFAALGVGRATRRPAAWITTSGTAVANGQPAVVEASEDGVPMVLLTADRPPELQKTGANQTIDQEKIFGNYVRWTASMPPPNSEIDPTYVLTTVDQAVHQATRTPPGPVHLNCAFRKPLEPVETEATVRVPDQIVEWGSGTTAYTQYPASKSMTAPSNIDALADALQGEDRGLIVAGRLDTAAEAEAVRRLAGHLGWPLLPDLTSRLRLGPADPALRIAHADLLLTMDSFREAYPPNAVLQVGGRFNSKRIRHYLRDSAPSPWAVVRPDPGRVDPDHRVTHHFETHIEPFVGAVVARTERRATGSPWARAWTEADEAAREIVTRHADEPPLTEPAVATLVSRHLPSGHALVASSSMPVRDLNRHAVAASDGPAFANRGASGIDGTVATASGVARGLDQPVTLLIGDLALWHDLNSLPLAQDPPLVVVVVNNNGGGIFHFLPIREYDEVFEPYFTTPQNRTFEEAAATFDLKYWRADTPETFVEAYSEASSGAVGTILEVQTDRQDNREHHRALERQVRAALEDHVG